MKRSPSERLRIVIGNTSLAGYRQGGGHWLIRLQWMLGLRQLGHDPYLLCFYISSGDATTDSTVVDAFFSRLNEWGLARSAALVVASTSQSAFELKGRIYGTTRARLRRIIDSCDMLWNDCAHVREPLLSEFSNPVLVDLDPGHLQISALEWDLDVNSHTRFLTVGMNVGSASCSVPTLGKEWQTFLPPIYLPIWEHALFHPPNEAPLSSVTHWTWGELHYKGRRYSISKRDAYLRYVDIPKHTSVPHELAVHFDSNDTTGDQEFLDDHGWRIVDPWRVADTPKSYANYISASLGEFSCPKPVFRELRTGWFSDRSAAYLAAGRPVIAEETGFSDHLPADHGLFRFTDANSALEAIEQILEEPDQHRVAAKEIAHEYFDSRRQLSTILEASCGTSTS